MRLVSYQHQVDVEVQNLVAHVHAEVVAEMVPQVGEGSGRALEVSARHFHSLKTGVESVRLQVKEQSTNVASA